MTLCMNDAVIYTVHDMQSHGERVNKQYNIPTDTVISSMFDIAEYAVLQT